MSHSYWSGLLKARLGRRRVLAASGAGAAASVLLAACGSGGGSGSSVAGDKSGLLSQAQDTTRQAVRGGVWQDSRDIDPVTLDPIANNSALVWPEIRSVYNQLVKAGIRSDRPEDFEGDAAQSWEVSGDGLQVTFKMRPNLKLDPRPPTNGRLLTATDVKWSYDRFASVSPYRGEIFNSITPTAPVESFSAPDEQTVVVKLAFPYGPIIEMLGFGHYLYIAPREGETFDLRGDMRGTGPFRLNKYTPSVGLELVRNPDYYLKDRPFLDGWNRTVIPDYSAALAQFESKVLWSYGVRQEDILRVKTDHPELVMLQVRDIAVSALASTPYLGISKLPDSMLRDVRLRRAASMLIDRDAWIDTFYNVDVFRNAGLPSSYLWNAHLPAGAPDWADPKGKELGEGARYFQYDPAEAKKLMSAAGYTNQPVPFFWHNQGNTVSKRSEVLAAMLEDGGFRTERKSLDYNTEWRQTCQTGGEGFLGFCYNNAGGFNQDAYLAAKYTPSGKFAVSAKPIEGVTDLVQKARLEIDGKKRGEMVVELQRKLALEMPDLPIPGLSLGYSLRWPWFKNHGVFLTGGDSARENTEYWYDAKARV